MREGVLPGPSLTVAALYRRRWRSEQFFRTWKQNLRVKSFVGTSANAVLMRIGTARDRDTAWEVPDAAIVLRLVVGESDSLVAAANVRLPRLTAVAGSTVSSAADAPRPRRRAVTTALSTTLVGQPEASNRGSALPEASGGHILSRRINRAVGKRLLIWTAQRHVTPLHSQAPNRPVGTQHAAPVCTCLERECIDEMDY